MMCIIYITVIYNPCVISPAYCRIVKESRVAAAVVSKISCHQKFDATFTCKLYTLYLPMGRGSSDILWPRLPSVAIVCRVSLFCGMKSLLNFDLLCRSSKPVREGVMVKMDLRKLVTPGAAKYALPPKNLDHLPEMKYFHLHCKLHKVRRQ